MRVSGAARRVFDGPAAIASRPEHRAHLRAYASDLVRPYGWRPTDGVDGHSYGEMGAALVRELAPARQPVDLLVLAFAVPDVRPGRATATYLSHLCPGRPLAFAVCDQGSAAAFTGLRLVRDLLRSGDRRSALLLLVEQAGLPYEPGPVAGDAPLDLPTVHAAVGLRCEAGGPGEAAPARLAAVRQHTGVAVVNAAAAVAVEVADHGDSVGAPAGGAPVALIADAALAGALPGVAPAPVRVHTAAPGQPLTGVWWELVGTLAAPTPGRVVLAGHDRRLGYLCTSTFDIA